MTGISPRYVTCTRCGVPVLEARWDFQADTLIGTPLLDPVTLDHQQITACVITSIPLWQIQERAGKHVTSRRSRYWPRKPVPGHVAPEHACGRTWDAFPLELAPETPIYPDLAPF